MKSQTLKEFVPKMLFRTHDGRYVPFRARKDITEFAKTCTLGDLTILVGVLSDIYGDNHFAVELNDDRVELVCE